MSDPRSTIPPLAPVRRVGVLCEFESLNGGEHSLLALVPALRDRGWDPVVLAPSGGDLARALVTHRIEHVEFRVADDRETAVERLGRLVDESRLHLLHANSLSMCRLSGRLARQTGFPTTGHLRDIVNLSTTALADINSNRLLLAVSHATGEHHVAAGLDAERLRVVHNGIDVARFQQVRHDPQREPGWLKRELNITRNSCLVATIGQIGLRKALDVLAEAATMVADDIDYVIVGQRYSRKAESVEFETSVFETFARAAPAGCVHRLGTRDDVPELLAEIDVLVHPARQEPLGRVLLEAAAAEVAILATDVGGTREILENDHSALLVEPDDPTALATGLDALTNDQALRARLAATAFEEVRSRFPIDAAADGLVGAWQDALSRSDCSI